MSVADLRIGTSGWAYKHWEKGVFYPVGLATKDELAFYARHYDTAEVNYSFYRLPQAKTYENWKEGTPEDFLFSVKASRFITHIKRLRDVDEAWPRFIENALLLEEKLAPVLFQFPQNFVYDLDRLRNFLTLAEQTNRSRENPVRFAFEFRHESWFQADVYKLLNEHNSALCIADGPKYPRVEELTADFSYIRYHGKKLTPNYSKKDLVREARFIEKLLQKESQLFVYFNNDTGGYAIKNADYLKELLAS